MERVYTSLESIDLKWYFNSCKRVISCKSKQTELSGSSFSETKILRFLDNKRHWCDGNFLWILVICLPLEAGKEIKVRFLS